MDSLIQGLEPFTVAYLNDLVIFRETWEDHSSYIRQDLCDNFYLALHTTASMLYKYIDYYV